MAMDDEQDYDARIVELYDLDNPDGPDHEFFRRLADRLAARSIVDLGCGTGLLTVTLAQQGRSVVGVDPSPAMLDFARRRAGADRIRWVTGDSSAIDVTDADLVIMSGNVAQHIIGAEWPRTLTDARAALRPGGVLAFESRNPDARAWEDWAAEGTTVRDTRHGQLTEWTEVSGPDPGGVVELRFHTRFERSGDDIVEFEALAFRSRADIEHDLSAAGLVTDSVSGDWDGTPFGGREPIMVFLAHRP